jgi:hypothetical protein
MKYRPCKDIRFALSESSFHPCLLHCASLAAGTGLQLSNIHFRFYLPLSIITFSIGQLALLQPVLKSGSAL